MRKIVFVLGFLSIVPAGFCQVVSSSNSIEKTTTPNGWMLHTRSSVYQVIVNENGEVIPVYFGNAAQGSFSKQNTLWTNKIHEVLVRGGFANKTPAVEVVFDDNVRDIELKFKKGEIINVDGYPTLKITQNDKTYPLQIISYLRVIPQWDIIEKWIEVINIDKKNFIRIENLQSASINLPADAYELNYVSGYWAHEYQPQVNLLTPGVKTLQVKDFKSYGIPAFIVGKSNTIEDTSGASWFGSLQYSGNWRITN